MAEPADSPPDKCAICGIRDATGRDHVPPRNIFPKPWPSNLITVPACEECNNRSSPNDEEFRVSLSLLAGSESPETRALWKEGALRTLRRNRKLHREVLRRFVKVDVKSPGGIYLHTADAVMVPKKGIHSVLQRTIRGLYFHHFGECLGERARCDVKQYEDPAQIDDELLRLIRGLQTHSIANGLFRYRYDRAGDEPLASIWLMMFHNQVPIIGYTMPAEDDWRP